MQTRSLQDWLALLEQRHPRSVDLGLERVAAVAQRLGVCQLDATVITVAGTNGKGSFIAALSACLACTDGRVGVYTSPHLQHFSERIRIDGEPASDAALVAAFDRVEACLDGVSLTYFEFTTLAALDLFARSGVECALLEVGLGGRLDAVNIVDADIAVIASIALDHQEWLGSTRDEIAMEKAGILRNGQRVAVVERQPPDSLRSVLAGHDGEVAWISADFDAPGSDPASAWRIGEKLLAPPPGHVPTLCSDAWAAALQVSDWLGALPSSEALGGLLSRAGLAGRLQRVSAHERSWLLDVAHNPAAVFRLADYLQNWEPNSPESRTVAVFGAMADKDIGAMLAQLDEHIEHWFLVSQPELSRAADASYLAQCLPGGDSARFSACGSPEEGINAAIHATSTTDKIIVFGSFPLVGSALDTLGVNTRVIDVE